ncbi:hypothetical protein L486_04889 [Kwoniella mangroviensis CBS 10435]|uniref:Uncharacterized protein n=1 Tax=Kwoniella mangroviensis CBS 10435 TaxID=1331196 RepID=A0A1B9IPL1_9TREE|nr:hypothetical protein L486_04889 [Kwoniella mangroviensis CBS 10435]
MSKPNTDSLNARSRATLDEFDNIVSLWSSKRQEGMTLLGAFDRSNLKAQHDAALALGDQDSIADTRERCELVLKALLRCYAHKSNGRSRNTEATNSNDQADGASSKAE